LLHGWPQHWWAWRHLIPPLAERYRVLAVDLRGWGWSDAPPGAYDKATFADDVLALLDAEGIERARLIGHDWGGFAGFLLAMNHPERLERFVALDIAPPWRRPPTPGLLLAPVFFTYQLAISLIGPRLMTSSQTFVRNIIRVASGPDAEWTDTEIEAFAAQLQEPARARASVACYRTFLRREFLALQRRRAPELAVPTLLIMGGAGLLNRMVRPQPMPNLRVEVIPRAGHFLAEEQPERVLELARPFLEEA
jgi:pimeloyl-ACP methyl ester carboxylesterase